MYPDLEHGQVILYGGPGFRATFLDNAAKQRIFDDDMLPRLRDGDFDGALLVAMERVDAAATPEHAADARAGAPAQCRRRAHRRRRSWPSCSSAGAAWSWLRFGRDPVYLDDPSIHMAGPPEALTPGRRRVRPGRRRRRGGR